MTCLVKTFRLKNEQKSPWKIACSIEIIAFDAKYKISTKNSVHKFSQKVQSKRYVENSVESLGKKASRKLESKSYIEKLRGKFD